MLLSATAFATDPETVSPVVKAAFQHDFINASKVSWEKTDEFYFASFVLNNERIDAAYTEDGTLLGTARKISLKQIPLSVSLAIGEAYKGYEVNETVTELTYASVTRYYVTVSNDKQVLKLKCLANGDIEVEKKTKK